VNKDAKETAEQLKERIEDYLWQNDLKHGKIIICKCMSVDQECATTYGFIRFEQPVVHTQVVRDLNGSTWNYRNKIYALVFNLNKKQTPEHLLSLRQEKKWLISTQTQMGESKIVWKKEAAQTDSISVPTEAETSSNSEIEGLRQTMLKHKNRNTYLVDKLEKLEASRDNDINEIKEEHAVAMKKKDERIEELERALAELQTEHKTLKTKKIKQQRKMDKKERYNPHALGGISE
jgi:predicted RNase H-like nuclease (RuvC/YqgF family)